jgi:uncharacterized protein (TIGR02646 family)
MIFVLRTAEPDVLQRLAAQWLADLEAAITELTRVEADPNASEADKKKAKKQIAKAQNRYRHSEVKTSLDAMFHGKCAYCESKITTVTYGQIEHFYPKGQYVERTFRWDNLLLSCDLCNNVHHKGTKFPLDADGRPLLINPTNITPEVHLQFSWDHVATLACVYGRDQCGNETVQTFDLNGIKDRKELLKTRSKYVHSLMALIKLAEQGNEEAISFLHDACASDAPYAAFARACIQPGFPHIL